MSLYAFFETVDFFFVFDVPLFFFALILFTKEFLTPSLFFFVDDFFVGIFSFNDSKVMPVSASNLKA